MAASDTGHEDEAEPSSTDPERRTQLTLTIVLAAVVLLAAAAIVALDPSGDDLPGSGANTTMAAPTGTWTRVADSPLSPRSDAKMAWTGKEVLVIGGNDVPPCPPNASCLAGKGSTKRDAAAYDPATDMWRKIASVPVAYQWGESTAVVDGRFYSTIRGDGRLLRYDPVIDAWDWVDAPVDMGARTLVADGDRLIAPLVLTQGLAKDVVDLVLEPGADEWTELPADRLRPSETRQIHAVDGRLYLFTGGLETDAVRASVLEDGTWTELPEPGSDGYLPSLYADGLIMTPQDDETAGDGDDVPGWWALDTNEDDWVDVPEIPNAAGPNVAAAWEQGGHRMFSGNVVFDTKTKTWAPLGAPQELDRVGLQVSWAGDRLMAFGGAQLAGDDMGAYADAKQQRDAWVWIPN